MHWLYRFASNGNYPDPLEEIDALCSLDAIGEPTFLLLANRDSPPMSKASPGQVIGLCTARGSRLVLHGTAVVAGPCATGTTPQSVKPIYGELVDRAFCPLMDLVRIVSEGLSSSTLSEDEQKTFLDGQSFVKQLSSSDPPARRFESEPRLAISPEVIPTFPPLKLPEALPGFVVIGLDPTAGTWDSRMTAGTKKMPSFSLEWKGTGFSPTEEPLSWHETNDEFTTKVSRSTAVLTCIDGPCGLNGPALLEDGSGWNPNGSKGTRSGESALSRQGVNLFWTTQNTVMKFDGASRWIARSLVLFNEGHEQAKIETHPHGAFTFLWRMFGQSHPLPKKTTPIGRQARLAILRAFVPELADEMVPNHDAVDAACAALVAGLHQLDFTKPFGTSEEGGVVWMPDTDRLAGLNDRRARI